MYSRVSFVVRTLVVATVGFALLLVGLSHASAAEEGMAAAGKAAQTEADDGEPIIRATERISIPYGFDLALPLTNDGDSVVASGEGACTVDEEITIAFTVTQSSTGATASATWNGACTGELQTWTKVGTTATPSPNFVGGAGQACAFAETRDESGVTDTQEWCDDVLLASDTIFLPIVQKW